MTIELTMLAYTAGLTFLLANPYALGQIPRLGIARLTGNREDLPVVEGWIGRGRRAHQNMLENLPVFAAVVLVAHAAGISDSQTQLGAQLFFYGRLAHAIIYYAGIPWARTIAFFVSAIGILMILAAILF